MKNINNNLNKILKAYILIIIFLNKILFSQSAIGKKIKKEKQYDKEILKKKIINKTKKIDRKNNKFNKTFNINNLSSSAQERYRLENYYIEGNFNANNFFNIKNNNPIIDYIKENYAFIKNFFIENNIIINASNFTILLFFLNKYLSEGDKMREALNKSIQKKYSFFNHYNNIFKIFNNIKKNNYDENNFDHNIADIINNIIIFNASNKIEIERAINKFYNNANRKTIVLIIQKYNKNNFNDKENNNTYGDLSPNKDIYKKFMNHPYMNDIYINNPNNLFKRNFPEAKSIENFFYLATPKIKNNIVEYSILEEKNNNIEIQTLESIINNLNKNYFYSILIFSEKNISFIMS